MQLASHIVNGTFHFKLHSFFDIGDPPTDVGGGCSTGCNATKIQELCHGYSFLSTLCALLSAEKGMMDSRQLVIVWNMGRHHQPPCYQQPQHL